MDPKVAGLATARLTQQTTTFAQGHHLPQQQSEQRYLMRRWGRRTGERAGGELQKLVPILPGGRVAESVPPDRLRVGRAGDPQEPLDLRSVVEHERHERPILDGGDELSANRRSADGTRDRFHIAVNLESCVLECLLEFR